MATIWANLREYPRDFATIWGRPWGKASSILLFAMTSIAAGFGAYRYQTRWLTPVPAFLLPYIGVVLLWPAAQGFRFLMPVAPLYVFLMLFGVQELGSRKSVWARAAIASPVLVLVICYGAIFRQASYGVIRQTDGRRSFNELCQFIEANTKPEDVFIFRRSRALSLFTSRPAAVYDLTHSDRVGYDVQKFQASYVVVSPIFEEDRAILIPFVRQYSSHLAEVYENSDFQVYRVRDASFVAANVR
jgi:hypothetical protein